MLQALIICQNVLVLNRFPDISDSTILSKSLLFRSAFMAALIALIYGLQLLAEQPKREEGSARELGVRFALPSADSSSE